MLFLIFGVAEDHDFEPSSGDRTAKGARREGLRHQHVRTGTTPRQPMNWVGITPGTDGSACSLANPLPDEGGQDRRTTISPVEERPLSFVNADRPRPSTGLLFARRSRERNSLMDRNTGEPCFRPPVVRPSLTATHVSGGVTHRTVRAHSGRRIPSADYAPEAVAERTGVLRRPHPQPRRRDRAHRLRRGDHTREALDRTFAASGTRR